MMENLDLSQESHSSNDPERLAGYIRAVMPPSDAVIIQRAPGSPILDVDTAIFVQCNDDADDKQAGCKQYRKIGLISDIFGSVLEPMYSLQLTQGVTCESLRTDAEVFYLHEHSSTRYIKVLRDDQNRYSVIQE